MTAERVLIPPRSAHALLLAQGERCRVTDVAGMQVADAMFFSLANPLERFSQSVTRIMNWSSVINEGTTLFSNLQRPIAVVHHDTVGRHDTYFCSCSRYVYEEIYEVESRPGCRDSIATALDRLAQNVERVHQIPSEMLTDPLNCFQKSGFDSEGVPFLGPAWSQAGDFIEFEATTDLVLAVSACPDDVSECNGGTSTEIELLIHRRDVSSVTVGTEAEFSEAHR